METKTKPKGLNRCYKVTTIRDRQMFEEVITRQERARLDSNNVDAQIDESSGLISIKHKNGTRVTYRLGQTPGLGRYEWELLVNIVFSAGDNLPLDSAPYMNQRVRRLRRLFHDSKKQQWFFITTATPGYAIAINTQRTWRYIEAIAE